MSVRADPVKRGLFYAGTSRSVYVSFDDGANWQPLSLNLPTTWYRDLLVHDGDLITATQGRGIWILDDVEPLREAAAASASRRPPVHPARRDAAARRREPRHPVATFHAGGAEPAHRGGDRLLAGIGGVRGR